MAMDCKIIQGDALTRLRQMESGSVHCCISSPPYFSLRDYGVAGQIGLEKSAEEYVSRLVEVFREVKRVLRNDGSLWLNLGDTYNSTPSNQNGSGKSTLTGAHDGTACASLAVASLGRRKREVASLPAKNLLGVPWRVAFALQADGWILRSAITWCKGNPMPESVQDRPAKATEMVFLLAKSQRYYYDPIAVREGNHNRRDWWLVNSQPLKMAHFAVMPAKLVEPCVLAGTSQHGVCAACGAPWRRALSAAPGGSIGKSWVDHTQDAEKVNFKVVSSNGYKAPETLGWQPTCSCNAAVVPATLLDPFAGAATVGVVAQRHGRRFVGIELSKPYIAMARRRLREAAARGARPARRLKLAA